MVALDQQTDGLYRIIRSQSWNKQRIEAGIDQRLLIILELKTEDNLCNKEQDQEDKQVEKKSRGVDLQQKEERRPHRIIIRIMHFLAVSYFRSLNLNFNQTWRLPKLYKKTRLHQEDNRKQQRSALIQGKRSPQRGHKRPTDHLQHQLPNQPIFL